MTPGDLSYGPDGLLPVVVQHQLSGQVLMVGFANEDAVGRTLASGRAWFFSRSRQQLWQKGETSGNVLSVSAVQADCDADTLIYRSLPAGPTCHTGEPTCFFQVVGDAPPTETDGEAAHELFATVLERQASGDTERSYVSKLLSQGVDRVARKVGEEATEVVIAAKNGDRDEVAREIADLWFHTFILLAQQGMTPADVWTVLRERRR